MTQNPPIFSSAVRLSVLIIVALSSIFITHNSSASPSKHIQAHSATLEGVYEPSGVQQSGRVTLIIEDEVDQPLHTVVGLGSSMSLQIGNVLNCGDKLNDLEGIATDGKYFYLAGSHHTKADGTRRKKREIFARLSIKGNSCTGVVFAHSLYKPIRKALKEMFPGQSEPFSINIEALSWKQGSSQLYIALREPLAKTDAILLVLNNPLELFDNDASPIFSKKGVLLPLAGGGVRAMDYIAPLGGYLLSNETEDSRGKTQSRLWFWPGGSIRPIPVNVPAVSTMPNIEGLTAFRHQGRDFVLFVSDSGSRKKKRGAPAAIVPLSDIEDALKQR